MSVKRTVNSTTQIILLPRLLILNISSRKIYIADEQHTFTSPSCPLSFSHLQSLSRLAVTLSSIYLALFYSCSNCTVSELPILCVFTPLWLILMAGVAFPAPAALTSTRPFSLSAKVSSSHQQKLCHISPNLKVF